MSLVNFLIERYGPGMIVDTLKAKYPPGLVFIDALDEHPLPVVLDKWLDAHMIYMATQPPSTVPWDSYRHRFLTETPAIKVLMDLVHDLGMDEVLGVDVDDFLRELDKP